MVTPIVAAVLVGIAALAVAGVAESLHARRAARVRRLVFGPSGRPALWAEAAPFARAIAFALAAFGATALYLHDPLEGEGEPNPRASRQLLVVLDVSPSMNLSDAGPGNGKVMRGVWAGKVLQGILDRLDMTDTRVSMIAFYSKAIPMLQDSTDKNVLSNLMTDCRSTRRSSRVRPTCRRASTRPSRWRRAGRATRPRSSSSRTATSTSP